jgi:hypothetical protein
VNRRIAKFSSKSNAFDVTKLRTADAFTDALRWAVVLSLFPSYGDLRKYEVWLLLLICKEPLELLG